MKFSNFITVLSILVLALPSFGKKGGPNFIIIIGDDVGWDAFGCTGMKEARTPAIDKLAEESCMMTASIAAFPNARLCGPNSTPVCCPRTMACWQMQ